MNYYGRYEKAPGEYIQQMAASWESRNPSSESIKLVERFLSGLSAEYERNGSSNSEYVIDRAGEYFNQVRVRRLMEQCEEDLEEQQSQRSLDRIGEFRRIEMGSGSWINPLEDHEVVRDALLVESASMVVFPGAVGKFFGSSLQRDGLISFMGPEKRGKSFLLMETVYQALWSHCRVAYFEVGDMSQDQLLRRLAMRVTRRPLYDRVCRIPVGISWNESDSDGAVVDYEERELAGITSGDVSRAFDQFMRGKVRGKDRLRLSIHPTATVSAADILGMVRGWASDDGWVADVVVIDYADILAPPPGVTEGRDQINANWMQLRRLSQELHCLVVTATQADARSYDAQTVGMRHFSEDKRKLAHVTGMVGINQNPTERERGVIRLNWVVRREDHMPRSVHIAGCLAIASPVIKSTF